MSLVNKKQECNICYTTQNKHILCCKCEFIACVMCYKTYIISNMILPQCMKCKNVWGYAEIFNLFPATYIKELNKIHSEMLYSLNKSLLPEYANLYLEKYKINKILTSSNVDILCDDKYKKLAKLKLLPLKKYLVKDKFSQLLINTIYKAHELLNLGPEFPEIYVYKFDITVYVNSRINIVPDVYYLDTYTLFNISKYYDNIKKHTNLNYMISHVNNQKIKPEIKKEIYKPCKECNGFLDNSNKCSSCNASFCIKCNEKKDVNIKHKCDPNILENMKLIKSDSVACPKCDVYIYKIFGCNQMWCTNCNTPFDWRSKKILDIKNFHNPHYIDYLQSNKNGPANYNCDDEYEIPILNNEDYKINDFGMRLRELHVNMNNSINNRNIENKIIILSIKYLANEITDDQYKTKLQRLDKEKNKIREIKELNNVFKLQSIEVYNNFKEFGIDKLINEINKVIMENNLYRDELNRKYKCVIGFIDHCKPEIYGPIYAKYFNTNIYMMTSKYCSKHAKQYKNYKLFIEHLKDGNIIARYDTYVIMSCGEYHHIDNTYAICNAMIPDMLK